MAILCPLAEYQPLGPQTEPLMTAHDIICLHTMVGSLESTDNYFEQDGYGGVESHFGVGYDGQTIQWQDLSRQADANLEGNPRLVSIETADRGTGFPAWTGSNVPAWTEAQLVKISELVAWLCNRFDIPCALIPDSKPDRRGIGYHRQGIDPWRVSGGELWSEADGKVCPGDRRVAQITSEIIPRAKAILSGEIVCDLNNTSANKAIIEAGVHDYANTGDDWRVNPPNEQTSEALADELGFGTGNRSLVWKAEAGFYYGALAVKLLEQLLSTPAPPGSGATAAEVRQIVQEELAKLGIDYTP